jgi:hypothetical protein
MNDQTNAASYLTINEKSQQETYFAAKYITSIGLVKFDTIRFPPFGATANFRCLPQSTRSSPNERGLTLS